LPAAGKGIIVALVQNEECNMYICNVCGYVYDPAAGDDAADVKPGTAFSDLPSDWVCPLCGAGKDDFSPQK